MIGCQAQDNPDGLSGPIELPRVVDAAGAYQTEPFTRTVQDVPLFDGEAPSILITHDTEIGRVGRWRTQTLLVAKAGPGEVSYEAITIYTHSGYDADSGGSYVAEYYWPADVKGDDTDDLLILTWHWGGPGWFEGDPGNPPVDEPTGLRIITRKATDSGHPLGIALDQSFGIDQLSLSGLTTEHIQAGIDVCEDPLWKSRLVTLQRGLQDKPSSNQ
ncbi:MAG: hypothetical protein KTR15_04735 [Phycisphaeraceae bacterium]|nr:hypothetical protein [Phycisphaeraceae bacterium]